MYSVKENIGGIRHLKILIHLQISIQSANTHHMKEEPLNKERFFEYLTQKQGFCNHFVTK